METVEEVDENLEIPLVPIGSFRRLRSAILPKIVPSKACVARAVLIFTGVNKIDFKAEKSSSTVHVIKCRTSNSCPFYVRYSLSKKDGLWHFCENSVSTHTGCTHTYKLNFPTVIALADIMVHDLNSMDIASIKDFLLNTFGFRCTYRVAYRAKRRVIEGKVKDEIES
jgi:hypothetical protein